MAISSDSSLVLTGSKDHSVHIVNISSGKVILFLSRWCYLIASDFVAHSVWLLFAVCLVYQHDDHWFNYVLIGLHSSCRLSALWLLMQILLNVLGLHLGTAVLSSICSCGHDPEQCWREINLTWMGKFEFNYQKKKKN